MFITITWQTANGRSTAALLHIRKVHIYIKFSKPFLILQKITKLFQFQMLQIQTFIILFAYFYSFTYPKFKTYILLKCLMIILFIELVSKCDLWGNTLPWTNVDKYVLFCFVSNSIIMSGSMSFEVNGLDTCGTCGMLLLTIDIDAGPILRCLAISRD